jgi:hypothetical protein
MRTICIASLLAALASLSACSNPVQSDTPEPAPARLDAGIYLGTGHAVEPSDTTTAASRGSGYLGNGA